MINIDLMAYACAHGEKYQRAMPFPHIVIDNFFNEDYLTKVLQEFPDLSKKGDRVFNNKNENKLVTHGEQKFGELTKRLMHVMNSEPVLNFLQVLTDFQETLLPDPYFSGGGYHEIKKGGFLKIHSDFNKHGLFKLDRRINLLIYLNKDWKEEYGGHFELWNKDMTKCESRQAPLFNRVVIFSTTSTSWHGHPDPLTCPDNMSRKSLALYYYTNGRPINEVQSPHSTIFRNRPNDR